jgi:hypothetical protein
VTIETQVRQQILTEVDSSAITGLSVPLLYIPSWDGVPVTDCTWCGADVSEWVSDRGYAACPSCKNVN